MTALHTYSYIVVDTQRGCHTLKKKNNTLIYAVTSAFCISVLNLMQHCALDTALLHNLRMGLTKSLLLIMDVIIYILSTMHFVCCVHAVIVKSVRVVWFVMYFPQNIPI